jgi:hypothetical protein
MCAPADFSDAELRALAGMPLVPTRAGPDAPVRMLPPAQCYFLRDAAHGGVHSKLFRAVSVDFGPRANAFLSACGTKEEPSVEEIASILLRNPRHFWELAEGRDQCVLRFSE